MINYQDVLLNEPFSLNFDKKRTLLNERLIGLTKQHYKQCESYHRMLDFMGVVPSEIRSYEDIPFIPVRLFKERELLSINSDEVFKIMTSSGTSGQAVSKIFLDRTTATNQQKTLVKIVSSFTGGSRLPMLIIDSPSVIKNRQMFSARGAGILGFSIFGLDKTYALDDEMQLNIEVIKDFLVKHQNKKILLFGFTFMIWQHFYKALVSNGEKFDFSNAILIHGGGWKKLIHEAVSPIQFNKCLEDVCNISQVYNYYGMVEQTGSIYMECEYGHLHASAFSDIIIRNHIDFSPCEIGEKGIIQVLSLLPESYPGHSLLTEDEGVLLGIDTCPCGRKGKYFMVNGRLQNAEIRGCSDAYAARF